MLCDAHALASGAEAYGWLLIKNLFIAGILTPKQPVITPLIPPSQILLSGRRCDILRMEGPDYTENVVEALI